MRYFLFTVIAVVSCVTVMACGRNFFTVTGDGVDGDGEQSSEARQLGTFTEIESSSSIDVHVTCSQKDQTVTVIADSNIVPLIRTEVVGNVLKIYPTESYTTGRGVEVVINMARLDRASLSGSGDLSVYNDNTPALKIFISGSSDVTVHNLKAELFGVHISGSGDVHAVGKVGTFISQTNGSGDVDAVDLSAKTASIEVHGSGDARVNVSDSLSVIVSGSGDIVYTGSPKSVNQSIAGSGSVSKDN